MSYLWKPSSDLQSGYYRTIFCVNVYTFSLVLAAVQIVIGIFEVATLERESIVDGSFYIVSGLLVLASYWYKKWQLFLPQLFALTIETMAVMYNTGQYFENGNKLYEQHKVQKDEAAQNNLLAFASLLLSRGFIGLVLILLCVYLLGVFIRAAQYVKKQDEELQMETRRNQNTVPSVKYDVEAGKKESIMVVV